ncbi:MAG: diguanylate cyclase [Parachlamydia sp.]|nr:diguanylate cyclase [Parachlamydia sp.]
MRHILISDFEAFSRTVIRDYLDGAYHVFSVPSGTEAIELAQRQPLDLILLDMETPEGNGAEICSLLKEANATKYIPLILLSSCSQKEDIINGLHAGADDYLTKPICENELLARIEAHLRTKDYYGDLEKEDLLMLLELSEIISVTRNPKRILSIIVEKMVEAIDVSRCSIISLDDSGGLTVKASSDLPANKEIKIDLGKYPEIEKALTTQRPVVLQDIRKDPLMLHVRDKIQGLSDQAIFVTPIINKQNVIGTFFLRTASPVKEGISTRIFKLCQLVANISGNALENAVIFEAMHSQRRLLEELAIRDSLTGLYNHQQFYTRLEEEFYRAQRYALPLSCIFADIDNFKHINDYYGHVTGDVVLKQIGKLIERILRKSDIASRYGGEEFAVLLPNTSRRGAGNFAKRLEKEIEELSIEQLQGKKVSISVGVATCQNGKMPSCQDLIQFADETMYAAKQAKKKKACL